ncbi:MULTISPECIES: flagellar basal body rod protein FlgB [Clostridium]|uniref:Flagellar basal body rod protein FlgB n=1 Tax=Clostridium cibarium TaxID=2762247 RepID=A0ABR8PNU9_9CLOT|nr:MULTISPECIES: flagellar basal body rod protein FlgB [Clostridium]MBD7909848.1 flagellar basal body rod protein FlgB [Clostridium cibarium]
MDISLLGNEGSSYNLIKEGIQASNIRGKVIANNMANINTANYKRFNVVFEENLKGNKDMSVQMKTTDEKHMTNSNSQGNITVEKDENTSMREDGNNVDLDVEKVNQAANTLKYNALVQQANSKLSNIKYVISGGN